MVVEVETATADDPPAQASGNFGWNSQLRHRAAVEVTGPMLRGAAVAGSGDIQVDRIAGDSFDGSVAGSGDLQLGSVDVSRCRCRIAGSGDVSAGAGSARDVEYSIAGSGDIDAGASGRETAAVSIAGSGNVCGHATGTANVSIVGSGDVAPDRRRQVHGLQGWGRATSTALNGRS